MKKENNVIFDVAAIKKQFPLLAKSPHLTYLDTAASSQKPQYVLDAITNYYCNHNANIHRGVYQLSQEATKLYDESRETVRRFLNAKESSEIIFVRGATEGINLIAQTFAKANLVEGDEIILSEMEHHSNIVPWQMVAKELGAVIKVIPVTEQGELDLEQFQELLSERTKIVSVVHVSNSLGTVNPIEQVISLAHKQGAVVVVDGAQAAPHLLADMQRLDCDFYVFSGHKVYAPMGIGVVYGKAELLAGMPPYQGGGDMILSVSFEETTFQDAPERFEAGTPNVEGAVGLAAAIEFITSFDSQVLIAHETELVAYTQQVLRRIENLRIIGSPKSRIGAVPFVVEGIHSSDLGTILDKQGVAIRTGHHCTQPLLAKFGLSATARASFGVYNSKEDVDRLAEGIEKAKKFF